MTKQLVRFGAAVMTTLLALVVLWQFRMVVVYVLISLTLAAALRPLVSRLIRRGPLVARVAWILLYLVALGSVGFLLFLTGEAAINEIQQLAHTVSAQDAWTLPAWLEGSSFQQALVLRLPPPSKLFEAVTGDQGQLVLPAILGFTQGMGGVVSGDTRHSVLEPLLEHQSDHFLNDSGSRCCHLASANKRVISGAQSSLTSALTYAARVSKVSWPGCCWAWVTGCSGPHTQRSWR